MPPTEAEESFQTVASSGPRHDVPDSFDEEGPGNDEEERENVGWCTPPFDFDILEYDAGFRYIS